MKIKIDMNIHNESQLNDIMIELKSILLNQLTSDRLDEGLYSIDDDNNYTYDIKIKDYKINIIVN
jgi:hypothetical protein